MSDNGSRMRWDAIVAGEVVNPANDAFGFMLEPTDDPKAGVTYTWTVPDGLCNSAGNLQGGMLATFADAALGAACAPYLSADHYPALAEMKISILRPAPAGTELRATGKVLKPGRRVLFVEAEVTDAAGKLIAKVSGTEVHAEL